VGPESGPLDASAWTLPRLRISDSPKSTSLFRTLNTSGGIKQLEVFNALETVPFGHLDSSRTH